MKAIPVKIRKQIANLADAIADKGQLVLTAVAAFNAAQSDATRAGLEQARLAYNADLAALRKIYNGLPTDAQVYFDERSEGWQLGDHGSYYEEWANALGEFANALEDAELKAFAATAPITEPELFDSELPSDEPEW